MDKKASRLRRALSTRAKIKELGKVRLCVYRTPKHIYAQLIDSTGARVIAHASTLDKEIRSQLNYGGNVTAAKLVGQYIAKRGRDAGISEVAFDRSGFRYHGRIKALAEAAREGGLDF
ncbi:MAG: 50S ribosomal protein L18 [Coxiellaceae bacterium]|nr:MAG: 50S ribosomal protein L18 [Coxiellaceae bacterium]